MKKIEVISGLSSQHDFNFQQTYVLDGLSTYFIQKDASIPKNSFGFQNGVNASAVVQLGIDGEFTPG